MSRSLSLSTTGGTIAAAIDGGTPIYGLTPRDIRPVYDIVANTVTTNITAEPINIANITINDIVIIDKDSFDTQIAILFSLT